MRPVSKKDQQSKWALNCCWPAYISAQSGGLLTRKFILQLGTLRFTAHGKEFGNIFNTSMASADDFGLRVYFLHTQTYNFYGVTYANSCCRVNTLLILLSTGKHHSSGIAWSLMPTEFLPILAMDSWSYPTRLELHIQDVGKWELLNIMKQSGP